MINYGGDADFTGSFEPPTNIPAYLSNGQRIAIPHGEVGVEQYLVHQMFRQIHEVWETADEERSNIIESNYPDYPTEIKFIIDNTKRWEDHLTGLNIARAYYLHLQAYPHISDDMLANYINYLTNTTNKEFANRVNSSPTIKAVSNFVNTLHLMYTQASQFYRV